MAIIGTQLRLVVASSKRMQSNPLSPRTQLPDGSWRNQRFRQLDLAGVRRPGLGGEDKPFFADHSGNGQYLHMGPDFPYLRSPVEFQRIRVFETETGAVKNE